MKIVDAIAEILKREGVTFLSAYPTTPVIDATASGAATEAIEFSPGVVRAVRTRKQGDPAVPAVTMVRPDGYVAWASDD